MVNYYTAVTPQVCDSPLLRTLPFLVLSGEQWIAYMIILHRSEIHLCSSSTQTIRNWKQTPLWTRYTLVLCFIKPHSYHCMLWCICLFMRPFSCPSTQRAQAVLQAVSAVQDGSSPSSHQGVLDVAPPPSPVLRIIIDNMFYPVTLDVLQQVKRESVFMSEDFLLLTCRDAFIWPC